MFLQTETELVLKSRRVVPGVLLESGFTFAQPQWPSAAAELCARERNISRERQDEYAIESYKRSRHSIEAGLFAAEIVPVEVKDRRGAVSKVERDEEPFGADLARLPGLKPAFQRDGTVTAANPSTRGVSTRPLP